MSDSSRERCKIGEVRVNVNGLKAPEIFEYGLLVKGASSADIRGIQRVAVDKSKACVND